MDFREFKIVNCLTECNTKFLEEYPQITCAKYVPCQNLMSGVWLQNIVDRLQSLVNSTDDAKTEKLLGFVSHTEIVLSAMKSMGLIFDKLDTSAGFILEVRDTPIWEARFLFHEPIAADEHVIYKVSQMCFL